MNIIIFGLFILPIVQLAQALDNGLARRPPMGWIAWERFTNTIDCDTYPRDCINERLFRDMADRLVESGFKNAGYKYINIDDCWSEKSRNLSDGLLVADKKRFPSGIPALSDYIHGKNLSFGMYGDCGTATCDGYPAQLKSTINLEDNYFDLDAAQFAKWHLDSFKFDGCYLEASKQESICPRMAQALARTERPILLSCEWPFYMIREQLQPNWTLAAESCNLWRYYEDVEDSWLSILNIVDFSVSMQAQIARFHGPGHWFDPDQLVIGNWGLSWNQARAQMAIWSIWSAPLYMSNDLRSIRPEMSAILKNKALIEVNQDPLGIFGLMVAEQANRELQAFVKPVEPADRFGCPSFIVVYLNRATLGNSKEVSFKLRDLLVKIPIGLAAQRQQEAKSAGEPLSGGLIRVEDCKSILRLGMTRQKTQTPPPGLLVTPVGGEQVAKAEQVVPIEEKRVTFKTQDLFGDSELFSQIELDNDLSLRVNPSGVRAIKLTIDEIQS